MPYIVVESQTVSFSLALRQIFVVVSRAQTKALICD